MKTSPGVCTWYGFSCKQMATYRSGLCHKKGREKMAEENVRVANCAVAWALKEVNHYTAKIIKIQENIEKIEEKIEKIDKEIKKIEEREDFTGNEHWYNILKKHLKDEKEHLKEADNRLKFYFQLRADGRSTSKQSITESLQK